jgi:hypothetical protein
VTDGLAVHPPPVLNAPPLDEPPLAPPFVPPLPPDAYEGALVSTVHPASEAAAVATPTAHAPKAQVDIAVPPHPTEESALP